MFAKVSVLFPQVSVLFPKLNLAKALLAIGYTGIAAVFISALTYLMQISANQAAATAPLTLTFLGLNLVAWWCGAYAQRNRSSGRFGRTLSMLGDLLILLNVYVLCFLYLPPLAGQVSQSVSAALLVGICYYLYWYRRHADQRLPAPFYAYYLTLAGGATLFLTCRTLGLPLEQIFWSILGFGLVFRFLVVGLKLRPRADFLLAIMYLLAALTALSAGAFLARPTLSLLLGWYGVAGIICSLAWIARGLGSAGRVLGFGWYCALTLAFTGSLYYQASPPSVYVISTTIWIGLLTALVLMITGRGAEPFAQPAYWLSVLLGLGLIAYWGDFWSRLAHWHFRFPLSRAFTLPLGFGLERSDELLAPIALVAIGGAFLVSSVWQRRYPTIALSMWGYGINYALVEITSYLPLLLFVGAGSGLWLTLGGTAYGMSLAPFGLGVGYLWLSRFKDSLFPLITLRVAGYLAIFVAALTAFYNTDLALIVLVLSALVFLRRSVNDRSFLAHLFFLFMTSSVALPAAIKLKGHTPMLVMAAQAVIMVAIYLWLVTRRGRPAEGRLTLIWAICQAVATGVIEAVWGGFSPLVFLALWLGLLGALGLSLMPEGTPAEAVRRERDRWIRIVAYGVGHAAGAVCFIPLLRELGFSARAAGPAIAVWAWAHFGLSRWSGRLPRQAATIALKQAVHGFAGLSILLAALSGSADVIAGCLLSNVALYFQMAQSLADESSGAAAAGAALSVGRRRQLQALIMIAHLMNSAAIIVAARQGASSAVWVYAVSALVFGWRSLREQSLLAHLYFLVLATTAAWIAALKLVGSGRMSLVGALAVGLLGVYRWLLRRHGRHPQGRPSMWTIVLHLAPWAKYAEGPVTLLWAVGLAATTAMVEGVRGPYSAPIHLLLWIGLLLGLPGRRRGPDAEPETFPEERDQWLRIAGYWVGHAAGSIYLILLLKELGFSIKYAGPVIAVWAWGHFELSRVLRVLPRQAMTIALEHAVHGFAGLSILLAMLSGSADVIAGCLLSNVALYFHMAQSLAEETAGVASLQAAAGAVFSAERRRQLQALVLVAHLMNIAAIIVAVRQGASSAVWVYAASALVFGWRSLREQSFPAHLYFLVLVTMAAWIAAFRLMGPDRMLLVGSLAVGLLGVYRWLLRRQGRRPVGRLKLWTIVLRIDPWSEDAEGPLTLFWAVALAVAAGIVEGVSGPYSAAVHLLIWIGLWIGLQRRKARPWSKSETASEEQDRRLRLVGYLVAHAAGGACLVSSLSLSGWPLASVSLPLVAWAWAHFSLSQLLAAQARSRVLTSATRQAVHGFALTIVLLACYFVKEGYLSITAAFLTGLLYLVLRQVWKQELLGDAAALVLITAFTLLGLKWQISLPDYYLSFVGLYLSFVLYRRFQKRSSRRNLLGSGTVPEPKAGTGFERDHWLTLAIVSILIIYPFWLLMQTRHESHIFYLGGATVLLLYLFMKARQHPIFVYLVCLLFVVGTVYVLALGHPNQWVNLFLALVGSLVITNQVVVGNLATRRLSS
ncbi:MAG TPA: hypothetical protein VJ302_23870 [Blastocatellia bacterium]|nr:hypothetical protein [Blastocatellia bacterium]